MYIRISISAQSAASTPPAPERMVTQRLALVVLARQQRADLHRLDVLAQLLELGVGLGERVGAVGALLFGGHFVEHRQVVEALPQLLDAAQLALGVRQLAGDLLGAGLVVPQVGIGRLVSRAFRCGSRRPSTSSTRSTVVRVESSAAISA